jgi:L-ascorbate metabolism protein UlaG (beta-lactamase superfamily)
MTTLKHAEKEGKVFLNPVPTTVMKPGAFWKIWKQYITNKAEVVPKRKLPRFRTEPILYNIPPTGGLRITWIGHSSLLIEIDGFKILTDPVWSNRASFLSFMGPKRFFPPPLSLEELPLLDAIILSHDHYDHLDKATINKLATLTTPFYCSLGVGEHLRKWGISKSRITEMDWTDSVIISNKLKITATPARHFSGRGIINRSQTLWSSFVIKSRQ